MAYTWHAVDLRSGKRGPQLRTKARGKVSRIIGEATDTQLDVLCWDGKTGMPISEWRQWTQPGRMAMVLVDDFDLPVWGGPIVRRIPNETEWVSITVSSMEHYLDRRYTGLEGFGFYFPPDTDQAYITQVLMELTVIYDGPTFAYNTRTTGILRTRDYLDSEDKTCLSLCTDLMNLDDGVEFTIDLGWTDDSHTVLEYRPQIASRVGTALPVPYRLEHPGPVISFQVPEDFTTGNGANDVRAVSSGEGDERPQSAHWVDQVAIDSGWARYEKRFTPSTSISDTDTLDEYALAEVIQIREGTTELSLVVNLDKAPRLGVDLWLGDDVMAAITAPAYPPRVGVDGNMLPGYESRVRMVGWEMDLDARTLTPSLREYPRSYP